ncbi:hypothetical protein LAWI1_G005336 [Lachnellula willkommii]|uniref:Uncharacterized protein n=1 Tax=Lachnellula willkommii TaxID=215461 RepID=A0A559M7N6_9HELO|nr:hypothetical protein LAWI1_G005336 [Lachnellula willkommii]
MFAPSTTWPPSRIIAIILLSSISSLTSAQTDNGNECSCFQTNGSSAGYFTSHRFLDYRNVPSVSPEVPALLPNITNATNAFATSEFFTNDAWRNDWAIQNWNNSDDVASGDSPTLRVNSPNNIYIEKQRHRPLLHNLPHPPHRPPPHLPINRRNRLHGKKLPLPIGALPRPRNRLPGRCAGIFTYRHAAASPSSVQEADIEILTRGARNAVQYTNQPSQDAPEATRNVTVPQGRDWTAWNTYRVDWMPGMSSWYVDGVGVAEIGFQAPRDPAGLCVNMWSDGGGVDGEYEYIQWVEVVFNTSGPYAGPTDKREIAKRKGEKEKEKGCKVVWWGR